MKVDASKAQEDIEIVVCNGHICPIYNPDNIVGDLCEAAGVGRLQSEQEGEGTISLDELGQFPMRVHNCLQLRGNTLDPPVDSEALDIGCVYSNPNVCVRGPKGDIAVHEVTSLEQITEAVREQTA